MDLLSDKIVSLLILEELIHLNDVGMILDKKRSKSSEGENKI